MKITWHGHSAFEIDDQNKTLIDPYFTRNRLAKAKPADLKPDVIAVTHGHSDHIGDTIEIAKNSGCKVVAVYEIAEYFESEGLDAVAIDFGGTAEISGMKYTLVPAVHTSRIDQARSWDGGNAAGFVISGSSTIYHAGDTAVFGDMSLIGQMYAPKVAMLPIGGYYTMDADAALIAVKMLKPKIVLPMHYNTHDLIKADPKKFKKSVEDSTDAEVILLDPGDSINV
jgi:L-ascorbate metabolism protein UlaG (beta-lactamase superfamily)